MSIKKEQITYTLKSMAYFPMTALCLFAYAIALSAQLCWYTIVGFFDYKTILTKIDI